ncbi:hypothetical protein ACFV5G_00970 [Streptomyces sp. NPDC059766]|uniref:hypothetical protein n=1 Tax=Streptomyces sp. NPDC059766 TaxID=3346940 RepID=UPI00364AB03B
MNWTVEVTAVSIGATFAVVVVFARGLLGIAQVGTARARDDGTHVLGPTHAGACFPVCASAVTYGIHPILPQFH